MTPRSGPGEGDPCRAPLGRGPPPPPGRNTRGRWPRPARRPWSAAATGTRARRYRWPARDETSKMAPRRRPRLADTGRATPASALATATRRGEVSSKTRPRLWSGTPRPRNRAMLVPMQPGLCYENGKGGEQDWAKAAEWYTKAAEQGDAYAQSTSACATIMARASSRDWPRPGRVHQGREQGLRFQRNTTSALLREWPGRRARRGQGRVAHQGRGTGPC